MTLITLNHLKAHNRAAGKIVHTAGCTRDWFNRYGLDFARFLKHGIDRAELEAAVEGEDAGFVEFLAFLDSPDGQTVDTGPMGPRPLDVQRERDRRILAGSTFTVAGYPTPIRLAGDPQTRENLANQKDLAKDFIEMGVTDAMPWRDEDNVIHMLSPEQTVDLWRQATMFVSHLYQSAWALIDNPPIPEDYAADERWPERSL